MGRESLGGYSGLQGGRGGIGREWRNRDEMGGQLDEREK